MYSEKNMGPVPSKDMQTPPLRSDQNFMKDAECAETNKKRFSDFCNFYFSSYGGNSSKIYLILSTKMSITRKIISEKSDTSFFF